MGDAPATTRPIGDRRRARFRDELIDAGIPVPEGTAGELFVDELAHARWAGIHERRRFGYGCVLNPRDPNAVGDPLPGLDHAKAAELSELRRYADGRRVFLVRHPDGPPQLVTADAPDELALVRLQRRTGGQVVIRDPEGIRVVTHDGSVGSYGDLWAVRPSAGQAAAALARFVAQDERDTLDQILDLCLHVLSPRHVGATVVWRLGSADGERFTRAPTPPPVALSVMADRHLAAIAKRIALMDGACVLERDGTVVGFGAFLGWSREAEEEIAHATGLRHSSARWYSFDVPEVLVFVVSEDGPVSVFAGGAALLTDNGHSRNVKPPDTVDGT